MVRYTCITGQVAGHGATCKSGSTPLHDARLALRLLHWVLTLVGRSARALITRPCRTIVPGSGWISFMNDRSCVSLGFGGQVGGVAVSSISTSQLYAIITRLRYGSEETGPKPVVEPDDSRSKIPQCSVMHRPTGSTCSRSRLVERFG